MAGGAFPSRHRSEPRACRANESGRREVAHQEKGGGRRKERALLTGREENGRHSRDELSQGRLRRIWLALHMQCRRPLFGASLKPNISLQKHLSESSCESASVCLPPRRRRGEVARHDGDWPGSFDARVASSLISCSGFNVLLVDASAPSDPTP